jgi:hypothetical protein
MWNQGRAPTDRKGPSPRRPPRRDRVNAVVTTAPSSRPASRFVEGLHRFPRQILQRLGELLHRFPRQVRHELPELVHRFPQQVREGLPELVHRIPQQVRQGIPELVNRIPPQVLKSPKPLHWLPRLVLLSVAIALVAAVVVAAA